MLGEGRQGQGGVEGQGCLAHWAQELIQMSC